MDTRPRTSLISFCTVQLRTLCAAHSLATLCLFTTSGPDPGELPGFWGSMVFRHAPIPRKVSGKQQQQQQLLNCLKATENQDYYQGCGSDTFSVEAEAEARKIHRFRFHIGRKNKEKKNLVLPSFVEEQIGGAYTLRNESEEKSFREMLTST